MLILYLLKWAQKMFTKNVLSKHYDNFEFLDFALFFSFSPIFCFGTFF
jgi:hypothetical protein